jgi:hypothetical protein
MLRTKARSAVVAIVASLSVAGMAIVPTAAEAMGIKLVIRPTKVVTVCLHVPVTGQLVCQTRRVPA